MIHLTFPVGSGPLTDVVVHLPDEHLSLVTPEECQRPIGLVVAELIRDNPEVAKRLKDKSVKWGKFS